MTDKIYCLNTGKIVSYSDLDETQQKDYETLKGNHRALFDGKVIVGNSFLFPRRPNQLKMTKTDFKKAVLATLYRYYARQKGVNGSTYIYGSKMPASVSFYGNYMNIRVRLNTTKLPVYENFNVNYQGNDPRDLNRMSKAIRIFLDNKDDIMENTYNKFKELTS